MSYVKLSRPGSDEAASYYHSYIAAVPDEQIGFRLVSQLGELAELLEPLDESAALARYAEGKWSIKELVGHLSDAERIYAYRLLRISRGDVTPLPAFDENAYVSAGRFDERSLVDLHAEFKASRLSTIALVEGIPTDCWAFLGQAGGHAISARALPYIAVGHAAHHMTVLRTRYGLTLASDRASLDLQVSGGNADKFKV